MNKSTLWALALALGLAAAGAAHAATTDFDFGLTAGYESNAPRAESASDRASESTVTARLGVAHSIMLDEHSGLTLNGALAYENHRNFGALNNATARLDTTYRIQPVAGYSTPWYEVTASVEALKFADSSIRDGSIAALSATAGKNFTDRVELRGGLAYEQRRASYDEIYNLDWRKAFVSAAYRMYKFTAYTRFTRIWGDQVFSVQRGTAIFDAKATEDDPAFGPDYYAYRMGAITNIIDLGLVGPLSDTDTIAMSASHYLANAEGGHRYTDSLLQVSWVHRF